VFDGSSIWVPVLGREQLAEIDTVTNRVVRRVPGAFSAAAAGFGSVWVTEWRGAPPRLERWYGRDIARVNPRTAHVHDVVRPGGTLLDIGTGFGSVWAADFDRGLVWRIDPRSGRITARIPVGPRPSHLAFGFGSVWVMSEHARVVRISPARNRVEASVRAPIDGESDFVTTGAGAVWIVAYDTQLQGTLVEIDPTSNSVTRTVPVGQGPQGVAVEGDSVWIGHLEDGTLWRVSAHP
jgi:YVTN family beta-propeller protein